MQKPRIVDLHEKKIIGCSIETSLSENRTKELWSRFMPEKKKILNTVSDDLYSIQVFGGPADLEQFTPQTKFIKWAGIEVSGFDDIPGTMEQMIIPAGKYAVFIHYGRSDTFPETSRYIFGSWLPSSDYELDDRPHFEVMGEKYLGHENPESEEEVWIPVNKLLK